MTYFSDGSIIYWMRRDMRLHDNHALFEALNSGEAVIPVFIFDRNILDELPHDDARVTFIHDTLSDLKLELIKHNSDLRVFYGEPIHIFKELISKHKPKAIYTNRDYEPYAQERDQAICELIESAGGAFFDFKDHVITEKQEILSNSGSPYTVFTP